MARTTPTFAAIGLVLGGLGAVGWHFQPVFEALGPPRPFQQVLQALGETPGNGPFYSGVVSYEELSWWHDPSWIAIGTLVAFGGLVGTAVGALLARVRCRAARNGRTPRTALTPVAPLVLGLLIGGGSALTWHWNPEWTMGTWNSQWFWPVDVLYPIAGAVLGLTTVATARTVGRHDQPSAARGSRCRRSESTAGPTGRGPVRT